VSYVYQRGNIWWLKYYRNGKPYRESSRSDKETDARRLLRKREGEIAQGKIPGVYFDRVRFDELAEDFLRDYRLNNKTVRRAEQTVAKLRDFFGGYRVPNITSTLIEAYIEKRMKWTCEHCGEEFDEEEVCPFCGSPKLNPGATKATVNRELSALKRMLNLGAQRNPPKVDRVPHIKMLKENNVRKGFFEHGDFLALRAALPDYIRPIVTFAYASGWRLSEILGLTWERVDLQNGVVRIEAGETKNDDARTFYLDDELKEIFRQLFTERTLGIRHVFVRAGEPIKGFRKAWLKACKAVGLEGRIFHDLRRTAVRNMVRAGIPEGVAMKFTGHKTRSVFERYNIVSDADLREATKKREAYAQTQEEKFTGTKPGTIVDFHEKRANRLSG
jgi:integrase